MSIDFSASLPKNFCGNMGFFCVAEYGNIIIFAGSFGPNLGGDANRWLSLVGSIMLL